jgi:uncharacterized membrane protein (DUF2068 family)
MSIDSAKRPRSITLLAIVLLLFGIFAFVGSLFLWGQGFILQAPEGVNLAFPITDILVNAPASILAAVGLWTLKRFGYLASYFVAGFYVYASVYIFVEVITGGPPYPIEIVIPQVLAILAAVALLIYPNRHRSRFH